MPKSLLAPTVKLQKHNQYDVNFIPFFNIRELFTLVQTLRVFHAMNLFLPIDIFT